MPMLGQHIILSTDRWPLLAEYVMRFKPAVLGASRALLLPGFGGKAGWEGSAVPNLTLVQFIARWKESLGPYA